MFGVNCKENMWPRVDNIIFQGIKLLLKEDGSIYIYVIGITKSSFRSQRRHILYKYMYNQIENSCGKIYLYLNWTLMRSLVRRFHSSEN